MADKRKKYPYKIKFQIIQQYSARVFSIFSKNIKILHLTSPNNPFVVITYSPGPENFNSWVNCMTHQHHLYGRKEKKL
jgi:hypothetical protein